MKIPMSLDQLPTEILSEICLYLTAPRELLRMRLVSKKLENLVTKHALEHPNNDGQRFTFRNLLHSQFVKGTLFQANWRHLISPRAYSAADRILILANVAGSYQIETDNIIEAFINGLTSENRDVIINHLHVLQQFPALVIQSRHWPEIYQALAQIYAAPYETENRTKRYQAFQLLIRCATAASSSLRANILHMLVDQAQEIDNTDFYNLRTEDLSIVIDYVLEKMGTNLNFEQYVINYHILDSCIHLIKDPAYSYARLYEKCKATALKTHNSHFVREFNFFWNKIPLPYRQQAMHKCAVELNQSQTDQDKIIYLDLLHAWFLVYGSASFADKIETPVITSIVKYTTENNSKEVRFSANNAFHDSLDLQNEACLMHLTLPMLIPKLEHQKSNNHFFKLNVIAIFQYIKTLHPDDWIARIYTYFLNRSCDWRWFTLSFRVFENNLATLDCFAQMINELVPDRKVSSGNSSPSTAAMPRQNRPPRPRPDNDGIVADVHHYLRRYAYSYLQEYIAVLNSQELRDLVIKPSTAHLHNPEIYSKLCHLWLQCYDLQPTVLPDLLPLLLGTLNRPNQENELIENFISYLIGSGKLRLDNAMLQETCRNLPDTSLIKLMVNLMHSIAGKETDLRYDPVPSLGA